jgi:hypothetical protein
MRRNAEKNGTAESGRREEEEERPIVVEVDLFVLLYVL